MQENCYSMRHGFGLEIRVRGRVRVRPESGGTYLVNEGDATKLCLICLFSVKHVLRPNRVVAYTLVGGQNPFANRYLNSPIGSLLA